MRVRWVSQPKANAFSGALQGQDMESLYIPSCAKETRAEVREGNMHDVFSTLALAHVILVPHFLELAPCLVAVKGNQRRVNHHLGECVARPLLCLLSCQGGVQDLQGRDPQVQFAQPFP